MVARTWILPSRNEPNRSWRVSAGILPWKASPGSRSSARRCPTARADATVLQNTSVLHPAAGARRRSTSASTASLSSPCSVTKVWCRDTDGMCRSGATAYQSRGRPAAPARLPLPLPPLLLPLLLLPPLPLLPLLPPPLPLLGGPSRASCSASRSTGAPLAGAWPGWARSAARRGLAQLVCGCGGRGLEVGGELVVEEADEARGQQGGRGQPLQPRAHPAVVPADIRPDPAQGERCVAAKPVVGVQDGAGLVQDHVLEVARVHETDLLEAGKACGRRHQNVGADGLQQLPVPGPPQGRGDREREDPVGAAQHPDHAKHLGGQLPARDQDHGPWAARASCRRPPGEPQQPLQDRHKIRQGLAAARLSGNHRVPAGRPGQGQRNPLHGRRVHQAAPVQDPE